MIYLNPCIIYGEIKLCLLKADYHMLRPIRKTLVDEGEFEDDEEIKGKIYRELKNKVQSEFGSAKQQRLAKKQNEKGVFAHGEDIDVKTETIEMPVMKRKGRK